MSTCLPSAIAGERLASRKAVPFQRSTEILPLLKLTGTCRNLFGPVDHDELRRELTSKLREISQRDQLRWNFDFSEGQPLNGDLKWEESPAEDCPEFYREKTAVSKRPFVDFPTTERIVQVAPKCGSRTMKDLNQKNKTAMCNRRKLSRKTVARTQTKRLADLRITGKQYATVTTMSLIQCQHILKTMSIHFKNKVFTFLIVWICFLVDFYGKRKKTDSVHKESRNILWRKKRSASVSHGGGKRPEVMTYQRLTQVITG